MPRVALSYRRDDSAGSTRLLFERLTQRYGHASVFMDIDAIALGEDFRERIDRALRQTDVLLVVIGSRWLGPLPDGRTRIMEANDPVRMEVELALTLGIAIVPVLLDHTTMPSASELPPSLEKLTYLNAADITSGRDFDSQMERIIGFLERTDDKGAPTAARDTRSKPRHNLPRFLTEVIGRDEEVAEIAALLQTARLVTIVGSGGIGKTRVAVQAAAAGVDAFGDGVWFVDLSPLADPRRVPSAIAEVLDIAASGDARAPIDAIAANLKAKSVLLVLDNCEHVLAAVSEATTTLLRACADLRVLTTSREPLGVPGEEAYRMPVLAVPPHDERMTAERVMHYPAAALFVTRARAAMKTFTVTDDNAPFIADIVHRLDGIALAIELAAPRMKVLSVQQLDQRLNDRFKLLTGGRTGPSRQQTLRATIAWSYDLLSAAERSMLDQCAIFRGGWTLEAAEAVCTDERFGAWDVLELLASLVDKSLVVVEAAGEERRYGLLESTREFALERLADADRQAEIATRHARYFAGLARRLGDALFTCNFLVWIAAARRDSENYRAAIDWGLGHGDAVAAATIVGELRNLWLTLPRGEGRMLVTRTVAALPDHAPAEVQQPLALARALFAETEEERLSAVEAAARVLGPAPDPRHRAWVLVRLGAALVSVGRLAEALPVIEESIAAARATRLPRLIAAALMSGAIGIGESGDVARAHDWFGESIALMKSCNDSVRQAEAHRCQAHVFYRDGDVERALASARSAEAAIRESGHPSLFVLLVDITAYLLALRRLDEAWVSGRDAAETALRDGNVELYISVGHLAHVAAETGDLERAALLLGYVDATYRNLGSTRYVAEQRGHDRALELIRAALPDDRIAALFAAGEAMEHEAAVAATLAIPRPGAAHVTPSA